MQGAKSFFNETKLLLCHKCEFLTFENDDDLESLSYHLGGGQNVEGWGGVDLVHNRRGPDEEDLVLLAVSADHELVLVVRQHLALLCHLQTTQWRDSLTSYSFNNAFSTACVTQRRIWDWTRVMNWEGRGRRWRALMNMIMNLRVHKRREFLD